jgi:hypothetical protein
MSSSGTGALPPYAVLVPHSKWYVVSKPLGSIVAFRSAVLDVTFVDAAPSIDRAAGGENL